MYTYDIRRLCVGLSPTSRQFWLSLSVSLSPSVGCRFIPHMWIVLVVLGCKFISLCWVRYMFISHKQIILGVSLSPSAWLGVGLSPTSRQFWCKLISLCQVQVYLPQVDSFGCKFISLCLVRCRFISHKQIVLV